jgi:hypothetical protein
MVETCDTMRFTNYRYIRYSKGEWQVVLSPSPTLVPSYAGADGFDFWVGEWNGQLGGGGIGMNTVTREYAGRVIKEHFTAPELNGESASMFSPVRQMWWQTWVDDAGNYLLFAGRREPDRMVLEGRRPDGQATGMRMVWDQITPSTFEWDYQKQEEDGTWTSQWHISYRRRGLQL